MKRLPILILLLALALAACVQQQPPPEAANPDRMDVTAAAATELFFSEYVEGSSYNKALEIYNGTAGPVDLGAGGYSVVHYSNGNTESGLTLDLQGTVAAGDVFVLAHSSAADAVLAAADQNTGAGLFNGDDALVLFKGSEVVDSIGQIGVDPANPWGSDPTSTQNNTLRRKTSVCAGDTNPNNVFDPAVEWDGFAEDTFDGLGSHTATCEGGGEDPPTTPVIVINEVMQNPDAVNDGDGEWFELYNPGTEPVDIDGWTIEDNDTDMHVISDGGPLLVPPGGYLVLGNNNGESVNNGGVSVDYVYSSIALANGDDELVLLTASGVEVDRVEWDGGPSFPDPTGASMALSDPTLDNNDGSSWCTASTPFGAGDGGTPGAANDCASTPPPPAIGFCGDEATLISAIQGDGFASPIAGSTVVIEGVVVGDFQEGDGDEFGTDLDGFYVQEEDGDRDSDPATSEGIFVFAPGAVDVSVGDVVRVGGTVDEFFELTEITDVTGLIVCDTEPVTLTPTPLELPLEPADREAVEGMLVILEQDLVISEYFNFDRFNEIVLALPNPDSEDRPFTPTSFEEPGGAAAAEAAENALSRITLDDGRGNQNPDPARHPNGDVFDLDNRFRGGDVVSDVVGVMDYSFDLYRIQPTAGATYDPVNPRPMEHEAVGGELKVAAFNVLNYFTTLGSRGADNATEFERQRDKIFAALEAINADVVGLIEIENNTAAIENLVSGLNNVMGAGTYDYIDTGVIGTDEIKVAFIYKPSTVTPVGEYAVLDSTVDPRFIDTKNRPVLAQTFMQVRDGAVFTAVVNHLKSKGSDCNEIGDPDLGDGQGNCNLTRKAAAEALVDWLAGDPTGSGDSDFLILGDLNSYDQEDPIDVLRDAGYTDLGQVHEGEFAYTYVFDGQFGHLDYAMASESLLAQVTGTTNWHINADEPDILDYDSTFKQPAQDALYEVNPFRSSDHDPVIVGLNLTLTPICSGAEPSQASLWPPNHKMAAIQIQGVTDPEGDDFTIEIDSIFQDEPVDLAGGSDGSTSPDGAGIGTDTAEVRVERIEGGNGRVYHIGFTATDEFGAACSGSVEVSVPSSRGRNGAAVDDGSIYDSTETP